MHKDFIKEKIRLEQYKFEIVYIKNLWAILISLGGSLLVFLQLFFSKDISGEERIVLILLMAAVSSGLLIGFWRYLSGKKAYMRILEELMHHLENEYDRDTY